MKSDVTFGKIKKPRNGKPLLSPSEDAPVLSDEKPPVVRPKIHLPPKKRMAPAKPAPLKREEPVPAERMEEPGPVEVLEQEIEQEIVESVEERPRDMFDEQPAAEPEPDEDDEPLPTRHRPWDLKFALGLIALVVAINIALTIFLSGSGKEPQTAVAEPETRKLRPVTRVTNLPPPPELPSDLPSKAVGEAPAVEAPPVATAEPAPLNLPAPALREAPIAKPAPSATAVRSVPAISPEQLETLTPAAGTPAPTRARAPEPVRAVEEPLPPPPSLPAVKAPPVALPQDRSSSDELLQILNKQ